jgi:predicted house-cleaning noncanonical NTP pyrophosphatase (MazG superfamily)
MPRSNKKRTHSYIGGRHREGKSDYMKQLEEKDIDSIFEFDEDEEVEEESYMD